MVISTLPCVCEHPGYAGKQDVYQRDVTKHQNTPQMRFGDKIDGGHSRALICVLPIKLQSF